MHECDNGIIEGFAVLAMFFSSSLQSLHVEITFHSGREVLIDKTLCAPNNMCTLGGKLSKRLHATCVAYL